VHHDPEVALLITPHVVGIRHGEAIDRVGVDREFRLGPPEAAESPGAESQPQSSTEIRVAGVTAGIGGKVIRAA